jgi:hypothetical protein
MNAAVLLQLQALRQVVKRHGSKQKAAPEGHGTGFSLYRKSQFSDHAFSFWAYSPRPRLQKSRCSFRCQDHAFADHTGALCLLQKNSKAPA